MFLIAIEWIKYATVRVKRKNPWMKIDSFLEGNKYHGMICDEVVRNLSKNTKLQR